MRALMSSHVDFALFDNETRGAIFVSGGRQVGTFSIKSAPKSKN